MLYLYFVPFIGFQIKYDDDDDDIATDVTRSVVCLSVCVSVCVCVSITRMCPAKRIKRSRCRLMLAQGNILLDGIKIGRIHSHLRGVQVVKIL